jgi:hypothetical protein
MKAGGKQSIWLADISEYIRNRREMEDTTEQANEMKCLLITQ